MSPVRYPCQVWSWPTLLAAAPCVKSSWMCSARAPSSWRKSGSIVGMMRCTLSRCSHIPRRLRRLHEKASDFLVSAREAESLNQNHSAWELPIHCLPSRVPTEGAALRVRVTQVSGQLLVVSVAHPGQRGTGHISLRSDSDVQNSFIARGMRPLPNVTRALRAAAHYRGCWGP